ncbi:MAG: AAA family ATPase [Luteitalea sp.]|nr:AAA family ATPase [Luteitalea sp.]
MTLVELDRALRKLRLSGMADVLETRLRHAQAERLPPLDLVATLVSDELQRREDRLVARRHKQAAFRDPDRSLENFDFDFNKTMNRALIFDLATGRFIQQREDALFLGPPGTGKSHLAQAIGRAAIQQGYRVTYREAHTLLEQVAEAAIDGTRKTLLADLATVPLLIIDDLGMRKLPHTAAEDLLELIMRRYERAATLLTSNRHAECAVHRGSVWAGLRPPPLGSLAGEPRREECEEAGGGGRGAQARGADASDLDHPGSLRPDARRPRAVGRVTNRSVVTEDEQAR